MATRYNLVFEGKVAVGKNIEDVKDSLCPLFKSNRERIDSLFTPDKRPIIKGNLDYEQAVKFKDAFEKTGALCVLVEMGSTAPLEEKSIQSVKESVKTPVTITEPREFYLKRIFKLIVATAPFTLVLSAMRMPFNLSQMPKEGATVLTAFFFLALVLAVYLIRKFWQPALILSAQGVEYRLANLFKPQTLLWSQIQGITIDEQTVFGKTQVKVRLLLSPDSKGTTEMEIGLGAFEGGDEALSLLKQMIPEKKSQEFSNTLQKFKSVSTGTMKYRDVEIVSEGLITTTKGWKKNRLVVPWDNIVNIKTAGFVIAGYGPVVVVFLDKGVERKVLIRASTTEQYHDCIKLLITNARNATLDPGVIAILEYPISSAKADMIAVLLIFTGVIFGIAGSIILSFYPSTIAETWIYPLLLLPLCAAPFAWTIKLVSSRFKGGGADPSKKIAGASLFNVGTILSVAILFSLSPASFLWLLADSNTLLGRMDAAEAIYLKAEPALAKNEDFLFTLGQFYSRKGEWSKASQFYIRSYEKDPTNWMPQPLTQIPNSLCMAGKCDEALQWCDRIAKQYSGRREVVSAIERKKNEIRGKIPAGTEAVTNPASGVRKDI